MLVDPRSRRFSLLKAGCRDAVWMAAFSARRGPQRDNSSEHLQQTSLKAINERHLCRRSDHEQLCACGVHGREKIAQRFAVSTDRTRVPSAAFQLGRGAIE